MRTNPYTKSRNFSPSNTVRAAAGLGLVLITAFAGSARADDLIFGFAAATGGGPVAVDGSGNVYMTGQLIGTQDFDPGPGIFNLTADISGIYVVKLNSVGNFVWAKAMTGTSTHGRGNGIAVDAAGNVYTTGEFWTTVDFDPGPGTFNLTSASSDGPSAFVSKLDSNGNFVWAKRMGGNGLDPAGGRAIDLDASGNVYTTGGFHGTADFDPGPGTFNLTSAGTVDIFVSKLDSSGNFVWAKAMGGTSSSGDLGWDIAVDAAGNVYTAGDFGGTVDFDPGPGTSNLTSAGSCDIFVSKLDTTGNFVWARTMGGTDCDGAISIDVDSSGNVYTTGVFEGTADFDPGAGTANLTSAGSVDIFVSKLNSAGNFVWAKRMGGTEYAHIGWGIAVDSSGNVYTTGQFQGTGDFDPGPGTFNLGSAGEFGGFLSKLDSSGAFVWATAFGDINGDIVVDAPGNVYVTGGFSGTVDFDPGPGIFNLTGGGGFVLKLTRTQYLAGPWVDFGFIGTEMGLLLNPFNTLAEALVAVVEGGTVNINGNTLDSDSSETMTIDQEVTIKAVFGTVRIGDSGGRNADTGPKSGFVSRD